MTQARTDESLTANSAEEPTTATDGKKPDVLTPARLRSFMAKIVTAKSGCWLWTAGTSDNGYGSFGGHNAHRTAYLWFIGDIPPGADVDHTCRQPLCVNPAHLQAVTRSENLRLVYKRAKTCRRGHPWVPDNIITRRDGVRTCRACRLLTNRASYQRVRARNGRGGRDVA